MIQETSVTVIVNNFIQTSLFSYRNRFLVIVAVNKLIKLVVFSKIILIKSYPVFTCNIDFF